MLTFNIYDISSEINSRGIMKTNKFVVEFPLPPYMRGLTGMQSAQQALSLHCEQVNLPGIALLMEESRRYGYGPNEKKPFAPIFTDVSMVVRGDGRGDMWKFLNTWMRCAINYEFGGNGSTRSANGPIRGQYPYEVGYKLDGQDGYAVDVTIRMFTDDKQETMRVVLREAFPIYVGDVSLAWGSRSDYVKIPVTLSFFDWFNDLNPVQNPQNNVVNETGDVPTTPV